MEKEKKMQVATFRFGVISDFVGEGTFPGERKRGCFGRRASGLGRFPSRGAAVLSDRRFWIGCVGMSAGETNRGFVSQGAGGPGKQSGVG